MPSDLGVYVKPGEQGETEAIVVLVGSIPVSPTTDEAPGQSTWGFVVASVDGQRASRRRSKAAPTNRITIHSIVKATYPGHGMRLSAECRTSVTR